MLKIKFVSRYSEMMTGFWKTLPMIVLAKFFKIQSTITTSIMNEKSLKLFSCNISLFNILVKKR